MAADDSLTAPANQVDPARCPLCGDANACGVAQGRDSCWCFAAGVPDDVLERVPPQARGLACVCARCALARASVGPEAQASPGPARSGGASGDTG